MSELDFFIRCEIHTWDEPVLGGNYVGIPNDPWMPLPEPPIVKE